MTANGERMILMRISKEKAAEMLLKMDNILILAHENPDGDAVGSASALCRGLRSLGKTAFVCIPKPSKQDQYLLSGIESPDGFIPETIVAVDTADHTILGVSGTAYEKNVRVALGIDHHISNNFFAENTYLDEQAAAAAEAVLDVLKIMQVPITKDIAECIYVGVSTDTGCFRYSNTTAKSLRTAAEMAETGIDLPKINKVQFETKSKAYAAIEKMAIASMQTYLDGKCAIITVTHDMFLTSGAADSETQPLSSLPRQIEGVLVGITMKEKQKGSFRISVRTNDPANASEIAHYLGGGGHKSAAGCTFQGTADDAVKTILRYTELSLKNAGLL